MLIQDIFIKCLNKWGLESQVLMLAEEASELSCAALGFLRKNKEGDSLSHLAEEIADVELMVEEIKFYLNPLSLGTRVEIWRSKKLERLEERLNDFKI